MSVNNNYQALDLTDRIVISRLSIVRISAIFIAMSLFVLSSFLFRDHLVSIYPSHEIIQIKWISWLLGQIIFSLGSISFLVLLVRRIFIDDASIYIKRDRLYYVHPVKYLEVPIANIKSLGVSPYPGMIVIFTNNGLPKYVLTMISNLSPAQTVDKIMENIKLR